MSMYEAGIAIGFWLSLIVPGLTLLFYVASFFGTFFVGVFNFMAAVMFWYSISVYWVAPAFQVLYWFKEGHNDDQIPHKVMTYYFIEVFLGTVNIYTLIWNLKHMENWYVREMYLSDHLDAQFRYDAEVYKIGMKYDKSGSKYDFNFTGKAELNTGEDEPDLDK